MVDNHITNSDECVASLSTHLKAMFNVLNTAVSNGVCEEPDWHKLSADISLFAAFFIVSTISNHTSLHRALLEATEEVKDGIGTLFDNIVIEFRGRMN